LTKNPAGYFVVPIAYKDWQQGNLTTANNATEARNKFEDNIVGMPRFAQPIPASLINKGIVAQQKNNLKEISKNDYIDTIIKEVDYQRLIPGIDDFAFLGGDVANKAQDLYDDIIKNKNLSRLDKLNDRLSYVSEGLANTSKAYDIISKQSNNPRVSKKPDFKFTEDWLSKQRTNLNSESDYLKYVLNNLLELEKTNPIDNINIKDYVGGFGKKTGFKSVIPSNFSKGGLAYLQNGGQLIPYEPKGTDTIPAMLTPGEFVVNAKATKQNLGLLHSINNGSKGFSKGGIAYLANGGMPNVNDITSIFDTLSNTGYPDDIIEKMAARSAEFKEKQAQKQKQKEEKDQKRKEQEAKDFEEGKRKNKERSSQRKVDEAKRLEKVKRRQEYINKITDAQNTFLLASMARERDALQATGLPLSELLAVNPIAALEREFRSKKGSISKIVANQNFDELPGGVMQFISLVNKLSKFRPDDLSPENMYDIPFPSVEMFNKGGIVYASKGQKISSSMDTIPAMLTPGEFVVNKNATSNNLPLLQSLNKGGSVRYYQYGGAVDMGNTGASRNSGPVNGYNLTINNETQNALSLFNKDFGSYVDKLVNFSFPSIPDKIEMVGNHTVDVRIAGAAAFEALQEGVKQLINNSIDEKMGELWGQTGGRVGKAPSLPSKK
jgi:hypothetical protein